MFHIFSILIVCVVFRVRTHCFVGFFKNVNAMYTVKENSALAAYPKREIVGGLELNPVVWQIVWNYDQKKQTTQTEIPKLNVIAN